MTLIFYILYENYLLLIKTNLEINYINKDFHNFT